LKKIFDVNALDLAKVGKAFGFAVPPRVNVNMGTGNSTGSKKGRKRARESDGEDVGEEASPEQTMVEGEREEGGRVQQRQGKGRRIETLGKKKVEKEVYRKRTGNWR
jgi:ATP-dependent RNA helicase DDX18/HAS1